MRDEFHRELDSLDQEVVEMGALVENSIRLATSALMEGDKELAQKVREGDDEIDRVFMDIEHRSLALLARQAPVARDLRLVVAILGVIGDLERSGDLAYNIAKLALVEDSAAGGLKEVRSLVSELGVEAQRLLASAIDAWTKKDDGLAADIKRQDDRLDALHAELIRLLLSTKGDSALGAALRLAMVGRYYERIGDHAVNLGERIRYLISGNEEYLG